VPYIPEYPEVHRDYAQKSEAITEEDDDDDVKL